MKPVQLYRLIQETSAALTAYKSDDQAGVIDALTSPATPVEIAYGNGVTVTTEDLADVAIWKELSKRLIGRYSATMDAINAGEIINWDDCVASINE